MPLADAFNLPLECSNTIRTDTSIKYDSKYAKKALNKYLTIQILLDLVSKMVMSTKKMF